MKELKRTDWAEILEENREKLIEAGQEAYKDALENRHLRVITEIDNNGDIEVWHDIAGGNSFHMPQQEDREIKQIFNFCFQFKDFDSDDEKIFLLEILKEQGREQEIEEITKTAKEEGRFFMEVVDDGGEYGDELYEAQQRIIEFEVDNSYGNIADTLDAIIAECE